MTDPVTRAAHLIEVARYAEAVPLLQRCLVEDPDEPRALALLASSLIALDRNLEAVEVGNRLVATSPDSSVGHRLVSVAFQQLGNRGLAYQAALGAVRADPTYSGNHAQVALTAHALRGRRAESRRAAAHAVALDPNDDDAHFAVGLTARSRRAQRAAYRQSLALNPTHPGAGNNLQVARGRVLSLSSLVQGYLGVLGNEPSYAVAQQNLVMLTYRFVRRYYWAGLGLILLALVAQGIRQTSPGLTWIGPVVGILALVLLVGYAVSMYRAIPAGPRGFILRAWRSRVHLVATTVHALAIVLCGLWALLLPSALGAVFGVVVVLIWANVALAVWGTVARRARRRR